MAATQGLPELSILRSVSDSFRLSSNSIFCAASSPCAFLASPKTLFMPSSMDRSAPAENASLPEVITTPFTAASAVVWSTMAPSSSIVNVSSTFMERPGMSHVTSAMPSASVSTLKFLKAMSFPLHALDDRGCAHAAADAQRHQRGRLVRALEFVKHGAENHRTGGAKRMAERDRAAIDVDLRIVDVESLDVAQHHGSKGFVEFEQVDI